MTLLKVPIKQKYVSCIMFEEKHVSPSFFDRQRSNLLEALNKRVYETVCWIYHVGKIKSPCFFKTWVIIMTLLKVLIKQKYASFIMFEEKRVPPSFFDGQRSNLLKAPNKRAYGSGCWIYCVEKIKSPCFLKTRIYHIGNCRTHG